MPVPERSVPPLVLGLAGAALGGVSFLAPWVSAPAAVVTAGAVIWQFRVGRSVELTIDADSWSQEESDPDGPYSFRIPRKLVAGRRRVTLTGDVNGEEAVVHADVVHEPEGSIVIRSSSTDWLRVHLS